MTRSFTGFHGLVLGFLLAAPFLQAVADEDAQMLRKGGQRLIITQDVMRTSVAYDPSTGARISFANFEAAQLGLSNLIQDAGSSRYERRRTIITYDRGITPDFALGVRAVWMDLAIHRQPSQQLQALPLPFDVPNRSSAEAWGDTLLGFKWRFVGESNQDKYRAALFGGLRAPTGRLADVQDPSDLSTGGGQWDLGLWPSVDWQVRSSGYINLTGYFEHSLPGRRNQLVTRDESGAALASPIVRSQSFQPGDLAVLALAYIHKPSTASVDWEFRLGYWWGWQGNLKAQALAGQGGDTHYAGPRVSRPNTSWRETWLRVEAGGYLFRQGLPLGIFLTLSEPLEGENAPKGRTWGLRAEYYF